MKKTKICNLTPLCFENTKNFSETPEARDHLVTYFFFLLIIIYDKNSTFITIQNEDGSILPRFEKLTMWLK